jgi:hypothetical protein
MQYIIHSSIADVFSYDTGTFTKWYITKLEYKLPEGDNVSISFEENKVLGILGNSKTIMIRILKSLLFNCNNIEVEYARMYIYIDGSIQKIERGRDLTHIYGNAFNSGNIFIDESNIVYDIPLYDITDEVKTLEEVELEWREYLPLVVHLDTTTIQTEDTLDTLRSKFYEVNECTSVDIDVDIIERANTNTLTEDDIIEISEVLVVLNDNNISTKRIQKEQLLKKIELYKQVLLRLKYARRKIHDDTTVLETNINTMIAEYVEDVRVKIDAYMNTIIYKKDIDITASMSSYELLILNIIITICSNLTRKDHKNCNIFLDCNLDIIPTNNILIVSKLISHMKSIYKNITILTRREEICDYCDTTMMLK